MKEGTDDDPAPRAAGGPGPRKSWGAGPALLALLVAFVVAAFITVIPLVAIGDDTPSAKATSSVVVSFVQNAIFVGMAVVIVSMYVGRLRRRDVGLVLPRRIWWIPVGAAVALVVYLLVSAGLGELLNAHDQEDDLPEKLGATASLTAGIAVGLAVTIFAPIGEEFLLRGVVYPGLRDSFARVAPAWVAIAIAALLDGLIFGVLHIFGSKAIFLPILASFGIVLCLLYQVTGSLYACILLHCTNNTIAIASSLDWSVLGGLALWVTSVSALALIALLARSVEARLPPPRIAAGAGAAD